MTLVVTIYTVYYVFPNQVDGLHDPVTPSRTLRVLRRDVGYRLFGNLVSERCIWRGESSRLWNKF